MTYVTPEMHAETQLQSVYERLWNAIGFFGGSYIAGGAIASLILEQTPNDYDIWFETLKEWETAVAQAEASVAPIHYLARTEHAMTFKLETGEVIQLVKSRLGVGEEVAEQFDFRHAQAYFYPVLPDEKEGDDFFNTDGEVIYVGQNCTDIIRDKILLFDGVLDYPIHTLSRLQKFALRGYTIPDQTIAKIVLAITQADPELVQRDIRACGAKYATGPGKSLCYAVVAGSKTGAPPSEFDLEEEFL